MPAPRYPIFAAALRRYFYSGWAFLIPYLFVYLLYYATGWPVHATPVAGNGPEVIGQGHPSPITHNLVPCLLHVYWALHAIHTILAGFALCSWWRGGRVAARLYSDPASPVGPSLVDAPPGVLVGPQLACVPSVNPGPHTRCDTTQSDEIRAQGATLRNGPSGIWPLASVSRPPTSDLWPLASGFSPIALRLLPWLFLALLFYIPGVYLEWPSDPWEHLRRINEWRILDTVGAHSSWMKSAYFIPYSLLSWCLGLRQLFWLDFYYTGICLLLCWQYYKLARACGLGERASMVFVIIQALLFGNNIFSFYRYYGISSSIYAQLGAVALTRVFLEWAARGTRLEASDEARQCEDGAPRDLRQAAPPERSVGLSERVPTRRDDNNSRYDPETPNRPSQLAETHKDTPLAPCFWQLPSVLWLLVSGICLLALTAFNHPQGIGIAGLGIAAVIVWRLIEWKRSALWWLIAGTLAVNALLLWLYPRPAIIETYRAQGYLNAWYGFNILDLSSPAGDRMLQIVSAFGLVNLAAALWLLRRNHVIAWLTLFPLVALLLPTTSLPFAERLASIAEHYVVTFQRMLFASPTVLALLSAITQSHIYWLPKAGLRSRESYSTPHLFATGSVLGIFVLICCTPASSPTYNRFWHTTESTANDLQLRSCVVDSIATYSLPANMRAAWTRSGIAATAAGSPTTSTAESRTFTIPPTNVVIRSLETFGLNENSILYLRNTIPNSDDVKPSRSWQKTSSTDSDRLINWQTSSPSAWTTPRFAPPTFNYDAYGPGNGLFVIENAKGLCTWILSASTYPVSRLDSFSVTMTIRQKEGAHATVFLAVAWYDKSGAFLDSGATPPLGAGMPVGWHNGIFSYFGASGESAPSQWSEYAASFGLGYTRAIPANAFSMRVGALLNANEAKNAIVQLCNIQLYKTPTPALVPIPAQKLPNYTFRSIAGILSTHWPAFQVATDQGGLKELFEVSELLESARKTTATNKAN